MKSSVVLDTSDFHCTIWMKTIQTFFQMTYAFLFSVNVPLKSRDSECHLCIPAEFGRWSARDKNHHVESAGNSWEQTVWQVHIGL